jgi:hypothetical protein
MDISPAALRKLRHALEDQGDGVVDELGLLALHTGYGDRFFPGTSVLQTRARYLFFVPWTYLALAASSSVTAANVRERKQKAELKITGRLNATAEQDGIIGTRTYPSPPAQPPDFAYWTALRAFGFYKGVERSSLLARWDRRRIVERANIRVRDEAPTEEPLGIFDVPEPPPGWPSGDEALSFTLTKIEAERLRAGFRMPGASLLAASADALRAREKPLLTGNAWDDSFLNKVAKSIGAEHPLRRAEEAAYLAQIARCVYAAHVEMLREDDLLAAGVAAPDDSEHYRELLRALFDNATFERAAALDVDAMTQDIFVPPKLKELVVRLRNSIGRIRRVKDIDAHLLDSGTGDLFRTIESNRKGARARLHFIHGRTRREGFGASSISVDPLHYRWRVARRLLLDLHEGLFS